jgi:hypothetical protein
MRLGNGSKSAVPAVAVQKAAICTQFKYTLRPAPTQLPLPYFRGTMRSKPVSGRRTSGTITEPSACW